jgi:hypothetical protein
MVCATSLSRNISQSLWYETQCVAVIQWGHHSKEVSDEFLKILLEIEPSANFAT